MSPAELDAVEYRETLEGKGHVQTPSEESRQDDDAAERLRKALAKHTKRELIDALGGVRRRRSQILRRLDERFELEAPPQELVAATRQAIADATDFDKRDINRNFTTTMRHTTR